MANIAFDKVPRHVGIIMDGNGRWATLHKHKRSFGHKRGARAIKDVAKTLFDNGVEFLSLYAFSTENFNRPKKEQDYLFRLLKEGIKRYGEDCLKQKVRLVISGDLDVFDNDLKELICSYVEKTQVYTSPVMNICLSYGARQELCRAFNLMIKDNVSVCDEQTVEKYLFNNLPPLDLVIRSGGEQRLSNFMLWQASYAELYFTDLLWPEFGKEETLNALNWFASRKRRFGKVDNA